MSASAAFFACFPLPALIFLLLMLVHLSDGRPPLEDYALFFSLIFLSDGCFISTSYFMPLFICLLVTLFEYSKKCVYNARRRWVTRCGFYPRSLLNQLICARYCFFALWFSAIAKFLSPPPEYKSFMERIFSSCISG